MNPTHCLRGIATCFVLVSSLLPSLGTAAGADTATATATNTNVLSSVDAAIIREMGLPECLDTALKSNHRRPASRFAVAMAEAQHRQALSAYWPQVTAKVAFQRMDEPPNFLFPASAMVIPAQTVSVPGGAAVVTIPANAFAPGFPPANIQMPVNYPDQTISTPNQVFPVPEQNVELMDVNTALGTVNATWLLWDGGMRRGLREQAQGAIDVAKEESRRTDLEITDSVRRMYFGAILARQLHQLGRDTLDRMGATLSLTETMYKEGRARSRRRTTSTTASWWKRCAPRWPSCRRMSKWPRRPWRSPWACPGTPA